MAGTITGESRKKFDTFFRLLISGTDKDHPKPKNIKLSKVGRRIFEYYHRDRPLWSGVLVLQPEETGVARDTLLLTCD